MQVLFFFKFFHLWGFAIHEGQIAECYRFSREGDLRLFSCGKKCEEHGFACGGCEGTEINGSAHYYESFDADGKREKGLEECW